MIALLACSRFQIVGGKHIETKKMRKTRCLLAFFSLLHQPTSSRTERLSKAIMALELTALTVLLDLLKP